MATSTNEAPNSLLNTTEYTVFYIQNVTKKIDFLFRIAITGKKKLLRITFISIACILVTVVVVIPVSIVMKRKPDAETTSTTRVQITTTIATITRTMDTSTAGSFER